MPNQAIAKRRQWTLESALAYLKANPHDTCIQYIAYTFARREGRLKEVLAQIQMAAPSGRTTDLMSILSGSAAIQESLQMDAMMRDLSWHNSHYDQLPCDQLVSELAGPIAASHDWKEMLGGRTAITSELSKCIPADFYIVESRSFRALIDIATNAESIQAYAGQKFDHRAVNLQTIDRVEQQLLLDGEQLELLTSDAVDEVAIAGSDLLIEYGSDATILVKASDSLTEKLSACLDRAAKKACIVFETRTYCGFEYQATGNRDRSVSAYIANPRPGLHVRSNSEIAMRRILEIISGTHGESLGGTDELAYVRMLMPPSSERDEVFVYFSDPFIRNFVSPELRLAQRRRSICQNNLKLLEYASLLYSSEKGNAPASIQQLADGDCLPNDYAADVCPDAGDYRLDESADGSARPICSFHGASTFMTPCLEIPITHVTSEEGRLYLQFLDDYNRYWRTTFDPIGVRITIKNKRYEAHTVILPLIDNSIYTGLSMLLKGKVASSERCIELDSSIFNLAFSFDKEMVSSNLSVDTGSSAAVNNQQLARAFETILSEALGSQIEFHVCDAHPTFSLDLSQVAGMAVAAMVRQSGNPMGMGLPVPLYMVALAASLQLPIYISANVIDADKVDRFLEKLPAVLAADSQRNPMAPGAGVLARLDFGDGEKPYLYTINLGPLKFRFFIARHENSVYMSTQPQTLEAILKQQSNKTPARSEDNQPEPEAPDMVLNIIPERWNNIRPEADISWHEEARRSCHGNLGYLTAFARARHALTGKSDLEGELFSVARVHPDGRACPSRGIYSFDEQSHNARCSVHGSLYDPRQPRSTEAAECANSASRLKFASMSLSFIEDGLSAKLILESG